MEYVSPNTLTSDSILIFVYTYNLLSNERTLPYRTVLYCTVLTESISDIPWQEQGGQIDWEGYRLPSMRVSEWVCMPLLPTSIWWHGSYLYVLQHLLFLLFSYSSFLPFVIVLLLIFFYHYCFLTVLCLLILLWWASLSQHQQLKSLSPTLFLSVTHRHTHTHTLSCFCFFTSEVILGVALITLPMATLSYFQFYH